MNTMCDSVNNDNFDSVSDYTDRVSGVVDNDCDRDDKDNDDRPYDKNNDDMPCDKDNDDMPYCKAQPHRALLGYPFCNTAAHTEATPTREGI